MASLILILKNSVLRIRIRDPGSGAFLTPGSGIRNRAFPDPGSRISDPGSQTHIFESLVTIVWIKSLFYYRKTYALICN
jgi:hypothetical protein